MTVTKVELEVVDGGYRVTKWTQVEPHRVEGHSKTLREPAEAVGYAVKLLVELARRERA